MKNPIKWRGYNAVAVYLMAGWLYENHEFSLLEDSEFDELCVHLDKHWDSIEHHHKHYIDRESLKSSTSFYLNGKETVPPIARSMGRRFLNLGEKLKLKKS